MKAIVTFQQMKRELLRFWQLRLPKSKGLFVLQHLPNRHIKNHGHDIQHQAAAGTSTHSEPTEKWHLRIYSELQEALFWVFSLEGFT